MFLNAFWRKPATWALTEIKPTITIHVTQQDKTCVSVCLLYAAKNIFMDTRTQDFPTENWSLLFEPITKIHLIKTWVQRSLGFYSKLRSFFKLAVGLRLMLSNWTEPGFKRSLRPLLLAKQPHSGWLKWCGLASDMVNALHTNHKKHWRNISCIGDWRRSQ